MAGLWDTIEKLRFRLMRRYWTRQAQNLSAMNQSELTLTRKRAGQTARLLQKIETAIAQEANPDGDWPIPVPSRTLWSMRPKVWSDEMVPASHAPLMTGVQLTDGVSVYHDCDASQISLRQTRNLGADATAPFSLLFDVLRFGGSYLSFAIEMPKVVVAEITKNDLIRLQCNIKLETDEDIFIRLNVRNGPNVEQISRHLDLSMDASRVEFDLFYTSIDFQLVTDIWVDLIVEKPAMNAIRIDDLTLVRRARANI